jgi:nitroreductase
MQEKLMTDFSSILKGRRSIRRYLDKEIPEEILKEVLESVRWAPSWANVQPWEIVVIKDRSIKERIQSAVSLRNPSTLAIVNAPVLLVICGQLQKSGFYNDQYPTKFGDWFMYDLGLATQNLCLTAHNAGLGTVIVGLFDHDKVGEIINLPANHEVVVLVPLGFPDQEPSARKRREVSEFMHVNTF